MQIVGFPTRSIEVLRSSFHFFMLFPEASPYLLRTLEPVVLRSLQKLPRLRGKTIILVDNSESMYTTKLPAASVVDRSDAACALAILLREVSDDVRVMAFSNEAVLVAPRRGFLLRHEIQWATLHTRTHHLEPAIRMANSLGYERLIVLTDGTSPVPLPTPAGHGYYVNISMNTRLGTRYGPSWTYIDGWSEAVVDYIIAAEAE